MSQLIETQESRASAWVSLGWWGALLVVCYFPVLAHLVKQWTWDPDVGHGFFVPLVAGYICWRRRDLLLKTDVRPNWWGLAVVIYGAVQLYVATLGAELFLARTAFVISIFGVVLFLGGTGYLRVLAFPLFLLLFMIPIPAIIYSQVTFPLQLVASRIAESALDFLGAPVLREGNILELANSKLSVVEACSGIRSLLSLSFISLVYGWLTGETRWMRVTLFVATVPVAILANAGRVTIGGLLTGINPELAEGFSHMVEGWIIFILALMMLVGLHQVLKRSCRIIGRDRNAQLRARS